MSDVSYSLLPPTALSARKAKTSQATSGQKHIAAQKKIESASDEDKSTWEEESTLSEIQDFIRRQKIKGNNLQ